MNTKFDNRHSGIVLVLCAVVFVASFILLGMPMSLLFRKTAGVDGLFDTGVLLNPRRFFLCAQIAACAGVMLFTAWLLTLWRFARVGSSPRLKLALLAISMIVGQLFFGVTVTFHPQVSAIQILYGRFPARTEYSKGFSRKAFIKVRRGMTRLEVESLIGRGYSEWTSPIPYDAGMWLYSKPSKGDNYWIYQVFFDADGRVSRTAVQYWYD